MIMVNLSVDLRDEKFSAEGLARALRGIEAAGFTVERAQRAPDPFLAWIDDEFGGTWSSEANAGRNVVVRHEGRFAGFATYDPHGLQFSWLRGLGAEPGVGIFGPFGVAQALRRAQGDKSGLGPNILIAALAGLREAGYSRALIPAVGPDKLIEYYIKHSGAQIAERFDKASWLQRRYRTVVLASGSGTNFQSVVDGVNAGRLPLDPVMLVSNKSEAYALQRAQNANIPAFALPWDRTSQTRAQYDSELRRLLLREEPELLLLLGWMHLLDDAFIAAFPHIINIHPAFLPLDQERDDVAFPDGSLTPAFRGAHAVRDALAWGARWVGASSHRVTLDADRGPVLVRKPLALVEGDTEASIMERLHPLEHRMLAGGIMRWVYER